MIKKTRIKITTVYNRLRNREIDKKTKKERLQTERTHLTRLC